MFQIIRRNIGFKFVGEIASRSLFLLFFFYLGRKLGIADFGTLNLAISTTFIAGVLFLDPGLTIVTVQRIVAEPDHAAEIAGSILSFKLILFAPMLLSLIAVSLMFGSKLPGFSVLFVGAIYTLCYAIFEYFCFITNAYHRMDLEAVLRISNRVLTVLFGIGASRFGRVSTVLGAMSLAVFLGCIQAWILLHRRLISVQFRCDLGVMRATLLAGLPVAGTIILSAIYLKWDLLVLSYFSIGRQEIGWYAGAFKLLEAFSALPSMLGVALFPIIVRLRAQDPAYLDRLLCTSTKAVLLVSIPTAAVICVYSPQIMSLVYGLKYLPGASVLAVLIWCVVPMFLYFYLIYVNVATGHAKHNLLAGFLALVSGLVTNTILVPHIGYVGAAWSALIANSTFALVATWKVCSTFRRASIAATLLRVGGAGVLMLVAFLVVPAMGHVQLLVGLLVYLIALFTFGTLGADDFRLASRLLDFRG